MGKDRLLYMANPQYDYKQIMDLLKEHKNKTLVVNELCDNHGYKSAVTAKNHVAKALEEKAAKDMGITIPKKAGSTICTVNKQGSIMISGSKLDTIGFETKVGTQYRLKKMTDTQIMLVNISDENTDS